MKPVVEKIQALKTFSADLASAFSEHLRVIGKTSKGRSVDFHTSASAALRILDIVVVLNYLKMACARLLNDFAMFKR